MDGLDIAYCTLTETGGKWSYQIDRAECIAFPDEWRSRLATVTSLHAKDLMLAHTAFGHWMGNAIQAFIVKYELQHKVHLIASHGHTVFHEPAAGMTFQMGDGAAIAAITHLPVVSDLRNMDIALGGQGAPIVPIGEKLLWQAYPYLLNIGGICNISLSHHGNLQAFDVCAANRVLDLLSNELGYQYDANGQAAATGKLNEDLLFDLNALAYYQRPAPKSLSNEFGTDQVLAIIHQLQIPVQDKLRTYCEHIAQQIAAVCHIEPETTKMLVTGGGAFNSFLLSRIAHFLMEKNIVVEVPADDLIQYKEALIMALIGVLRWREEVNVLMSVTGAVRSSIGGALWMGQD